MEIVLIVIAAWLVAAGINYLADVLPAGRQLMAVKCPHCAATYSLKQYLLFQPCRDCGARRTLRAWAVQVLYPLAVAVLWLVPPGRLGFWIGSGLLAYFAVVAVIDLEHRLILHPISWFGAVLGLLIGLWRSPDQILNTLLGGAAGFAIMYAFYVLGILFNRAMAKWRHLEIDEVALGFGDVNLAGIIGLMLGWPEIIGGLLIAILLGGLVSGLIMAGMAVLRRYQAMTAIPYAPFLLIGAIVFLYIPKN